MCEPSTSYSRLQNLTLFLLDSYDPKKNQDIKKSCHSGVTMTAQDIDIEFCWTALPPHVWEPCGCKWPNQSDVSWEYPPVQFHEHHNASIAKHVNPDSTSGTSAGRMGAGAILGILVMVGVFKAVMFFGYKSHKRREEISRRVAGEIQEFRDHSLSGSGVDDLQLTGEFGNPNFSDVASPNKIV